MAEVKNMKPEMRKHQIGMTYKFKLPYDLNGRTITVAWEKSKGCRVCAEINSVRTHDKEFANEAMAWDYAQSIWDKWLDETMPRP